MPSPRSCLRSVLATAVALASPVGCSRREPDPQGAADVPSSAVPVEAMDDPRLDRLLEASRAWRERRGPHREVVDQVVLAADVPTFFSALAAWDGRSYYPILIDDPRWTLPFVQAFRPSRVVRWPTAPRAGGSGPVDEWGAAGDAVSRSWVEDEPGSAGLPPAGAPPVGLGRTPPGLVLSHPGSPALAGAAALAAGRFQPLVRVGRVVAEDRLESPLGYSSTLTEEQAIAFARRIEARVASVAKSYGELGDEVDFLTLAGDWPFRYDSRRGSGMNRGDRAVDDLLGRVLDPGTADVDRSRRRWAYVGRLLGDAPASAYRAMAALFLQPESALLWNTYGGGTPWSDYDVAGAATMLRLIRPGAVQARAGDQADLAAWHEATQGRGGRDLLMVNSSGTPGRFSIAGGSGLPGDVPFGASAVVSMIHSFSAADPTDPDTLAGRFLERGTFVYYGSMNEPYLVSFRVPYIVAQLMVAEVPLAAAFRQGPGEGYGLPWRLVYLGDPLYRLDPGPARDRPARAPADARPLPEGASLLAARPRPEASGAAGTLDWSYDATLLEAVDGADANPEILQAVLKLDRARLDVGRRLKLDALLVDRGVAAGDVGGLLDALLRIPDRERTPAVWRAVETAAYGRLATLLREDRFGEALDLWERVQAAPWRAGSDFPVELTRRVAAAADGPSGPSLRGRLIKVIDLLSSSKLLPERREMLEATLRKLDNDQVR